MTSLIPRLAFAEALLCGYSVKDIALRFLLSVETVRSHVKSVLSKTGTKRQAEFLSKFAGFADPDITKF
ncbi:MAG: hypothetical protein KL863_27710 [Rhizobium sp.]|nr:hypothetical protein [Rhizobium sp.]